MDSSVPLSDFRALLGYALRTPAQTSLTDTPLYSSQDEDFSPESSGGFKKLVEGIHFSKRFILSYQLVLIGLLLFFTAIHWGSRLRAWSRRKQRTIRRKSHGRGQNIGREVLKEKGGVIVESRSSGSSSSSSTTERATSRAESEYTPLLPKQQSTRAPGRLQYLSRKAKAWLVYQPQAVRTINKTLPSNGASLVILAFIGLQIFYTFFKTPLSISMLFVFADRTSLLFVANLPLLYLLAAKNQPLKLLTGYSYESLNIFHRRLGEVLCLLALLHSVGMIGVWYTILRPVGITLIKFLLIKMILLGIGALIAYEMIYFTSLGSFRQRWYELFLGLHVVLQAAALVLVWFHHHGSRPYVGAALAIFLIDRCFYRFCVKSTTISASLEVKEDEKTVALRASVPTHGRRSLMSAFCGLSNITKGWKATEHVFLTVPSLSHKHVIQAHPFTIASRAPATSDGKANLELLVRAQDGFSADLVRYAYTHDAVAIRLDGPYGSQFAVHMLQDSSRAIIVAGGSGIAVTWPLVCSVLETFSNNDLEDSSTIVDAKRILFVWVIRDQSHIMWLGQEKLKELEARGVTVEIPPPTAANGHPDINGIIADWIASLSDQTDCNNRIGVVASGPDGLNRSIRNTCAALIKHGHKVHVEIEKFGW